MRHGRLAIAHHNGPAFRRRAEKQLREIKRQANATVAGGVAGQVARVHGDARPRQPLHVRHRRVVVFLRVVLLFFLEDAEDAARCGVAFGAGAHGRAADEDAIAINVHGLLGMLTSTISGPLGESCGFHQYSPGLSAPVGLPVGVPLVCAEGFSTAVQR